MKCNCSYMRHSIVGCGCGGGGGEGVRAGVFTLGGNAFIHCRCVAGEAAGRFLNAELFTGL